MLIALKIFFDRYLFALLFVLISATSFFYHSAIYTTALGGDSGISLLMSVRFDFTTDFYYWGQDRLGSFVPMLSHIIYLIFDANHVLIVSLTQYAILSFGCYFFTKFLTNTFSKLIFCVLWFFPFVAYGNLIQVGMPQGISLSFLIVGVYYSNQTQLYKRIVAFIFLFFSVWVSDLAIVSIFIFFSLRFLVTYKNKGHKTALKNLIIPGIGLPIILSLVYIFKQFSQKSERYSEIIFNNLDEVIYTLKLLGQKLFLSIVNFSQPNTVYIGLSIIALIGLLHGRKKIFKSEAALFFLLNAFFTFLVCIISHWVYINNTDSRYFADTYVSLVFVLCYTIAYNYQLLFTNVALFSLIGSLQLHYKSSNKSVFSRYQEFEKLGHCTLIGTYWHAYEISSMFPKEIIGIPHDEANIRNEREKELGFKSKTIFLNRTGWLDEFPKKIIQYNYELTKSSKPFEIQGFKICEYEVTKTY